jgi:hypothetical protein
MDEENKARNEKKRERPSSLASIPDSDVVLVERELSSAASDFSVSSAPASPGFKRAAVDSFVTPSPVAPTPVAAPPPPSVSPSLSARKRGPGQRVSRELRRLTEEVFDGVYWRTSVITTTTTTITSDAGTTVETLQEVEEDVQEVDEDAKSAESVAEEEQQEEEEEAEELALPALQMDNEEMAGAYLHSEAARLRQAKEVGNVFVPDLNGQVSMDGEYWKICDTGRRRQRRSLEFFPRSLKLGATAPSAPRAPLSPESVARRREVQMRVTAERRQEREEVQARNNATYQELVGFLSVGREIVPLLYLGGEVAADNTAWVTANVDFIVNCSGKRHPYDGTFASDERLLMIDVDDNVHCDIRQHFAAVAARLEAVIASGRRAFVHCRQGRSRSVSLVVAFLVLKRNMTLSDALQLVAEKNRGHSINEGFLRQLQALECAHRGLTVSSIFQSKETRRQ